MRTTNYEGAPSHSSHSSFDDRPENQNVEKRRLIASLTIFKNELHSMFYISIGHSADVKRSSDSLSCEGIPKQSQVIKIPPAPTLPAYIVMLSDK